jgi:hypothetical protein
LLAPPASSFPACRITGRSAAARECALPAFVLAIEKRFGRTAGQARPQGVTERQSKAVKAGASP